MTMPRLKSLPSAALAALALLLTACAAPPPVPPSAPALRLEGPIVLLGEVHDHAAQHRLRLAALRDWVARGARPALLMEQFDRERQAEIDALRARQPPPDADALIAAVGGPGWHWPHYRPFVELALAEGLPLVAVNVGRAEARRIVRDGLAAHGFEAALPADLLEGIAAEIVASHCGQVDAPLARRMARAQLARDQAMARAVEAWAQRGPVVLLAGNGHVRTDWGAPRWLAPAVRARSEAIGFVEVGDPVTAFDRRVVTPAQARPDPCAGMRPPT